jgi:viologen exporter family transport system permease protein
MRYRGKAYLAIVRTRLKSLSHFRANVLAWVLYSPIQLAVVYLLWRIIYAHTAKVGTFAFSDMILYYLVVHFLRRVIEPVQTVNYEVWSDINKGNLDIYLVRPLRFGPFVFCRSLGTPLLEIAIGIPFFYAFSWALSLPVQRDPLVLLAFVASVSAGYVILFLVQFMIGTLTFWMERIFGIRDMIFSVFMLFSGQLIPISVLPDWVVSASRYLPFEGIYFIPSMIYTQGGSGVDTAGYLLRQAAWIAVLGMAATLAWSRGIARYASQGG